MQPSDFKSKLQIRKDIWVKYKKKCSICGRFMKCKDVTIDHIVPRSRGGISDIINYAPAHSRCNSLKGSNLKKGFILTKEFLMKPLIRVKKPVLYLEKNTTNSYWEEHQKSIVEMFRKSVEILREI